MSLMGHHTIQYCNIDMQVTRSKLQSLKSLTSCRSIVTVVFNVYYKNECKFVPQACNIYLKSFTGYNVRTPIERLPPDFTILDF